MDDLVAGINDWRNIQEVVRETFKAIHNVVRVQGEKIKVLEAKVGRKVDSENINLRSFEVSLANKPTFVEVRKTVGEASAKSSEEIARLEARIKELEKQLASRASKNELKHLYDSVTALTNTHARAGDIERVVHQHGRVIEKLRDDVSKKIETDVAEASFARVSDVNQMLDRKANKTTVEAALDAKVSRSEFETSVGAFASTSALDKVLSRKVDMDTLVEALEERPSRREISDALEARVGSITQQVLAEAQAVAARETAAQGPRLSAFASKDEVEAIQKALKRVVEIQGTNNLEIQNEIASCVKREEIASASKGKLGAAEVEVRVKAGVDKLAAEMRVAIKSVQHEIVEVLNRKAFKRDVHESLKLKADSSEMLSRLARKAEVADVRDALGQKADTAEVKNLVGEVRRAEHVDTDAITRKVEQAAHEAAQDREAIRKLIAEKANSEDFCAMLDQKANVDDVNAVLEELNSELSGSKKAEEEAEKLGKRVDKISKQFEGFAGENAGPSPTGRWIWKTGAVGANMLVPWNVQAANSAPNQLLWSRNGSQIVVQTPGLYEISMGFFTERDPSVQLFVNGEVALAYKAPSSESSRAAKSRVVRRGRHSSGNVTGWTHLDFIALPRQARLSVVYDGEPNAQGFMGLQKL